VVFDKTGTLTEGRPAVIAAQAVPPFSEDDLWRLAASLESKSEHPLGAAVVRGAEKRGVGLEEARDVEAIAGAGVRGRVGSRTVAVGSADLVDGRDGGGTAAGRAASAAGSLSPTGSARQAGEGVSSWPPPSRAEATQLLVQVDGKPAGRLEVADVVKAQAADVVAALGDEGVRLVMLTGDHRKAAETVAAAVGLAQGDVRADVKPPEKAAFIRQLRDEGRRVVMAGDGINDAPALAAADVGVAMGTGTEVAVATAQVTLLRGDLAGLLRARRLGRATLRVIAQNLVFAFAYNVVGVPLAAGVLKPWLGWGLTPVFAAAAMAFSSVTVIANALRLRHVAL